MSLGTGVDCFRRGAKLAGAKSLRRFVWAPVAVAAALVFLLLAAGYMLVEDAVAWIMGFVPGWLDWLVYVLAPLFHVLGILFAGWLFGFLAVVLASPFLGPLSAQAEQEEFGTGPENDESALRALVGALAREGRKLGYHLPRLLVVFLLSLVPIVNLGAPVLWFVFGSWMLAVQFVDFAAENRGLDFRATISTLRRDRAAAFGFGIPAALLLAVPFAALLVIPAAVCGGAVLWRRLT